MDGKKSFTETLKKRISLKVIIHMKKVKQNNYAMTAKAGSHNDAKPCIALHTYVNL